MKSSRVVFNFQYCVEFTTPVTIQEGREWARKILDALEMQAAVGAPPELDEVTFKCSELRRIVKIKVD